MCPTTSYLLLERPTKHHSDHDVANANDVASEEWRHHHCHVPPTIRTSPCGRPRSRTSRTRSPSAPQHDDPLAVRTTSRRGIDGTVSFPATMASTSDHRGRVVPRTPSHQCRSSLAFIAHSRMTTARPSSGATKRVTRPCTTHLPSATREGKGADHGDSDSDPDDETVSVTDSHTSTWESSWDEDLAESLRSTGTTTLSSTTATDPRAIVTPTPPRRRVSYHPLVTVREYAVTVGDHPACADGLPLTLDWYYVDTSCSTNATTTSGSGHRWLETSAKHRLAKYRLPRRLTYDERRARLFECSAHRSGGDDDGSRMPAHSPEVEMVIRMLHRSWAQTTILPLSAKLFAKIEDVDQFPDDDDDNDSEDGTSSSDDSDSPDLSRGMTTAAAEPKPDAGIIYWQRVGGFRRQEAFSE